MRMRLDRIRVARGSPRREPRKELVPVRAGATVLLAEDDEEMREMLAAALRRDGFVVIEAADGDEALDWLGLGALEGEPRRTPTLLVSDIRMPFLTGLDLLEGLSLGLGRVPVLLITGFGDAETHARARALGASGVLDKPFELDEFRRAVHATVRGHALGPRAAEDGDVG
jgi:DNA-binding response OmpR family regulator